MPSTLQGLAEYREEIRKSRFHTIAAPVADEDEAQAFIAAHRDASAGHNCWAWKCGAQYRFSDDGEPGGSAGRPILAAIEGQDMDCVAVLVSRWFGGIKLGTGGLARAYGGGATVPAAGAAQRAGRALSGALRLCLRRPRAAQGAQPGAGRQRGGRRLRADGVVLTLSCRWRASRRFRRCWWTSAEARCGRSGWTPEEAQRAGAGREGAGSGGSAANTHLSRPLRLASSSAASARLTVCE